MKETLKNLEIQIETLKAQNIDTTDLEMSYEKLSEHVKKNMSTWDRVMIARDPNRPNGEDYIEHLLNDFIEFHGDRKFGDDGAIMGGVGMLYHMPITVIAIVKGKSTEENIKRNFGMVHPEGYRKALRLMKQAEKFNRPILTLIDTPGAYPGLEAEKRGQGMAIAENLMEMIDLKVPTLSIVLGEGGSGGALALSVTDEIWMMEHAIYSILSPEGFASILYKDASKAKDIVDIMKITSHDLKALGIVDDIIEENDQTMRQLKRKIYKTFNEMKKMKTHKLLNKRYEKYRNIGEVDHVGRDH